METCNALDKLESEEQKYFLKYLLGSSLQLCR